MIHTKMIMNVPLRLFKRRSSIEQSQADDFKHKLVGRYPWLSPDAIDTNHSGGKSDLGEADREREDTGSEGQGTRFDWKIQRGDQTVRQAP
jgi:hypothetical protein